MRCGTIDSANGQGSKINEAGVNERPIMLIRAKTLRGYQLDSLNGAIGTAKDFLFDDRHWAIRYLVADTGKWLTGRQVLLSPYALGAAAEPEHTLEIHLTKKQIEESPGLESDRPVSRQFETSYYGYYGWPMYWGGQYIWGSSPYIERDSSRWNELSPGGPSVDSHLRSVHEISGYHLHAADGNLGHVEDVIIDDHTWAIRYLIVDTHNWWPGKKVLVSPHWSNRVSWSERKIYVDLSRAAIKGSPEYLEDSFVTRDYESGLHRHYDRPGYWLEEDAAKHHAISGAVPR